MEIAKEKGVSADLIQTARNINEYMPHHVAKMVVDTLNEIGKSISNSKVGVLGIAYKANVAEFRETPSKALIRYLNNRGAVVFAHDPYVIMI